MKKLILGITLLIFSQLSLAGLMCDTRYENYVTDSLGCELGTTNNDSVEQVNLDEMFGETTWEYIFRTSASENEGQTTVFDIVTYDSEYGTFSIDWDGWDSILFTQKDGNGDPNTYVSWLLDPADLDLSYDFASPFLNTISGGVKDISHMTWYGISGGVDDCVGDDCPGTNRIPEPAPLALMGLGLLALRHQIKGRKRHG